MAVSLVWEMKMTATEILAGNPDSAPDATRSVVHTAYNEGGTLSAGTTPPVTQVSMFLLTLTAGAATISLRALTGTNAAIIDGNGLKVQFLRIKNLGANPMVFSEGAANGYAFGGVTVLPGARAMLEFNDGAPDIAAADKDIDVAGTAAQTAEISVVMG